MSSTWEAVKGAQVSELIAVSPYERSKYREGFKIWDAAIGVPACSLRDTKITTLNQMTAIRNSNNHWRNIVSPALKKVGPLGDNNTILRPSIDSKYHIDFKQRGLFEVIEAAHVLAHIRGDERKIRSKYYYSESFTAKEFIQAIAEIGISIMLDIPMNITCNPDPVFPYNIKVVTTTNYTNPLLIISCNNKDAMVPDRDNIIIHVAVHIEPYPIGHINGSNKYTINDCWCCMPSMVSVVGFEFSDYIAHQNIIEFKNKEANYIMHYMDLLDPVYLDGIKEDAINYYGELPEDNCWQRALNWLNTQNYYSNFMYTCALPCRECLLHNSNSEGRPVRPEGIPPKTVKKNTLWYSYEAQIKNIIKLIKNAALLYWSKYNDLKEVKKTIAERNKGYKLKLDRLKQKKTFYKSLDKIKQGKPLTDRERKIYMGLK